MRLSHLAGSCCSDIRITCRNHGSHFENAKTACEEDDGVGEMDVVGETLKQMSGGISSTVSEEELEKARIEHFVRV